MRMKKTAVAAAAAIATLGAGYALAPTIEEQVADHERRITYLESLHGITPTTPPPSTTTTTPPTTTTTTTTTPPPTTTTPPIADGTVMWAPTFRNAPYPGVIESNEYAFFNPTAADAIKSANWDVTSGTLYAKETNGWTGDPTPNPPSPNATSSNGNGSAVFRAVSKTVMPDPNYSVSADVNTWKWVSSTSVPAQAYDGVHLFLRYQNADKFYVASVDRRDGSVIFKKKCGPNDYYDVGISANPGGLTLGTWANVAASTKNNADGTVNVTLSRNGTKILDFNDLNTGCPAITTAGKAGLRVDNLETEFKNFKVTKIAGAAGPTSTTTPPATTTSTSTHPATTTPPATTTSTSTPPATTTTTTTASGDVGDGAPLMGTYTMPLTGAPTTNPGAATVVKSPETSPIKSASSLTGPRINVACTDSPAAKLSGTLAAGTVVSLQRGCTWTGRVQVRSSGTDAQPVLIQSYGPAATAAPVLKAAYGTGRFKDDGVIAVISGVTHIRDIAVKDSGSVGIRAEAKTIVHNVEFGNVVIGVWSTGQGTQVWNTYAHDLVMMPDTPGGNDDYGATGVVVEAHDMKIAGFTCNNCRGNSPDYNQYGGDGSLSDVWMKGNNLEIKHSKVYNSPRILEAGGLGQGNSATNMKVHGVRGDQLTDASFYFNPVGDYSGVNVSGFQEWDNVLNSG